MNTKYRNRPTTVSGIRFASAKEARRYGQLMLLEKAKRARKIRRQVPYVIAVGDVKVCTYRADFVYDEFVRGKWEEVVEDVKGYATQVYRLKKRLMLAIHGITIRET